MKVVLDTNVFISSFFGGNPRKIIRLWASGDITLCLSNSIVREYIEVLRRMGLENQPELDEILYLFRSGTYLLFGTKTPVLHVVKDDPDDNKFIECAVALHAEYIISGDRHLIEIEDYLGIRIVSPKKFLDSLKY